jgi:hypothetical protein
VWAERFDRNWDRIRALDPKLFDERFRRIWRVYLYGCAEMFRSPAGRTHLFQIVFSKGNTTSYPMTRDFLYRERVEAPKRRPRRRPKRRRAASGMADALAAHAAKRDSLAQSLTGRHWPVALAKETSNLFRDREAGERRRLDVRGFNQVLSVKEDFVEAEGMIPYEDLTAARASRTA